MSAEEAEKEPARAGAGGGFMKYLKDGENRIRILQEPDEWTYYWEHFNPAGFPFPCTNDRTSCPGCTSDLEKMRGVSRRVAFNAFDGQYTNVWKLPITVADKLKSRHERIGTLKDRDYVIYKNKNAQGRVDFDIEGQEKESFDFSECEPYLGDPEEFLAAAFEDSWGDDAKTRATTVKATDADQRDQLRAKIERAKVEEPAEDRVISEAELRKMEPWDLAELCKREGFGDIPKNTETTDDIVDWMMTKV